MDDILVEYGVQVVISSMNVHGLLHRPVDTVTKIRVVQWLCALHGQKQVVDISDVTFRKNPTPEEIGFGMKLSV